MSDPTDHALIRAAGSGEMDALGTLYIRHRQKVFELCYRMVGDEDAAQDLTQESFLRVLKYGKSFDGRSGISTWLYRLVRNRCLDFLSKERRIHDRKAVWAAQVSAEREVRPLEDDRQTLLREALQRLSPEMREILVLSRFEDLRYREIAEVCGISLANVKVRAHRAMKELRRIVHQLEESHDL